MSILIDWLGRSNNNVDSSSRCTIKCLPRHTPTPNMVNLWMECTTAHHHHQCVLLLLRLRLRLRRRARTRNTRCFRINRILHTNNHTMPTNRMPYRHRPISIRQAAIRRTFRPTTHHTEWLQARMPRRHRSRMLHAHRMHKAYTHQDRTRVQRAQPPTVAHQQQTQQTQAQAQREPQPRSKQVRRLLVSSRCQCAASTRTHTYI
jgi:hypothetical protein